MEKAYRWADVIVCRSGAMTVWEVATVGVAALFVPFPYAIDDHQTANARWLVNQDAAMIIDESDFSAEHLSNLLTEWSHSRQHLNNLAINARACAIPDSVERIAKAALEVANV